MLRAAVPKAPIDEHGETTLRKYDVGAKGSFRCSNQCVLVKPKAPPVKFTP